MYLSNPELCLEKSKKIIAKKPSEASPYYFVSSIYFDKTDKSTSARGRYLQLRRSLNYARKFEKLSNDELKEKVNWNERVQLLRSKTSAIVYELDKTNQEELSQELIQNLNQLESVVELKRPDNFEEIVIESNPVALNKVTFVKRENELYGMPSGSEIIPNIYLEDEQKMLELINKARIGKGLPPLTWNTELANASRYHAFDLASQSYFDHRTCDRIDGELITLGTSIDRIKKFYTKTRINAENIAAGKESSGHTYMQWFNSAGHNTNMFKADSRYIGIGKCYVEGSPLGYYWVMATSE